MLNLNDCELFHFIKYSSKHWNPKYRKERREKVIKVDLSAFENNELSTDIKRTKLKEKGIFPQKQWFEKPMYISCTTNVFEPYIPPEGDGKYSAISSIVSKKYLSNTNVTYRLKFIL